MTLPPEHLASIVSAYHQTLKDCEALYRGSAAEYARAYPDRVQQFKGDFQQRMLDLYRGLVIKVFVEIAQVDRRWSEGELTLAAVLFQHIWNQQLNDAQLKTALGEILERGGLSWDSLVGPFERLAILRQRAGELQTIVMRMANLIAKVDGSVIPEEVRQLRWIQLQLKRALERIPYDDVPEEPAPPPHRPAYAQQEFELSPGERGEVQEAILVETKSSEEILQETLAELDQLIGLASIKQEVRGLVNYLKMQRERERFGLPPTKISLHAVFTGNPGTGKTTVARLLGRIYGAMGILKDGHLVETDRSGLVAEFAGQTAPKTNKLIDRALDGVLFIDEAYSLLAEEGEDPYGAEAVQTLLKRMEDNRDRLIVVLAGYPEQMETLLKSNPGLSSRFAQHLEFPDYTACELGRIFEMMCEHNHYQLPNLTRVKLLLGFEYLLQHRDEHFGNGRLVRNIFEKAIGRLANRIASFAPLTREMLTTLEPGDIVMRNVPAATWADLLSEERRFRITCPACEQTSGLAQRLLGRDVKCKRCQHTFAASWGELITATEG
jgi:AAA+ superfamily predicted ATPase